MTRIQLIGTEIDGSDAGNAIHVEGQRERGCAPRIHRGCAREEMIIPTGSIDAVIQDGVAAVVRDRLEKRAGDVVCQTG